MVCDPRHNRPGGPPGPLEITHEHKPHREAPAPTAQGCRQVSQASCAVAQVAQRERVGPGAGKFSPPFACILNR